MRPRINLFQEEMFAVKNDWLDAEKAFWIVSAAILLVLMGSMVLWVQSYSLSREAGQLQEQEQLLKGRLEKLSAAFPKTEEDPTLVERIAQLEKEIKTKKQVMELLSGQRIGNRHGFSSQLTKLAQESFPDLWLTQMQLLDGGRQMAFVGRTLKSGALFDFLRQLTDDGPFKGVQFPYFQMDAIPSEEPGAPSQTRFGFATQGKMLTEAWKTDEPKEKETTSDQGKAGKGSGAIAPASQNAAGQPSLLIRPAHP